VTATFRVLYVFVVTDVGNRGIVHQNAAAHPTAEWTVKGGVKRPPQQNLWVDSGSGSRPKL
jgi:hypothetical protein